MADISFVSEEHVVPVRDGHLAAAASWVYVWLRPGTEEGEQSEVVHVGATGLPSAVRTWLHLPHEDPAIGRVRTAHADALEGELVVRAFRLVGGLDRRSVKRVPADLLAGEEAARDGPDGDAQRAAVAIASRLRETGAIPSP